jgi:hypothetical protein
LDAEHRQHAEDVLQKNLHIGAIRLVQRRLLGLIAILERHPFRGLRTGHELGLQVLHVRLVQLAGRHEEHRPRPEILVGIVAVQARSHRIAFPDVKHLPLAAGPRPE